MWHFHSEMLQSLPIGVCLIRVNDKQIVYLNPQFETSFGYEADELLDQHISVVNISALDGPLITASSVMAELERAGIWTGEVLNIKKNGTAFWCHAIIFTFTHPLLGKTWVLALIDNAEHKGAENTLHFSWQRLSLATHTAGIGIWEWDIVLDKLIWDEQMFALYGISQDDFSGKYKTWRASIHPEDLQQVEKRIQMALRGKKDFNIEFRVCRPDGTIRCIHAIATILYDVSGQPMRMIGTNWDITSLRIRRK